MSRTKKNPVARSVSPSQVGRNGPGIEVLTLAEAAAYLRLSEAEVVDLVHSQNLPGRFTGSEWRFLKAGLEDWLRTPARQSGKQAMLALAGAWKDDPDIDEIVRQAHKRRGRSIPEHQE